MDIMTMASDADTACKRYQRRIDGYLGPNQIGTKHIHDLHGLGYLPLEFRAIPKGTPVPLRVPMLTRTSGREPCHSSDGLDRTRAFL